MNLSRIKTQSRAQNVRTSRRFAGFLSGVFALVLAFAGPSLARAADEGPIGMFSAHGDVGAVTKPGIVTYDAGKRTYTIGSSGANMWGTEDAFQYVWKQVSGDVALAADISFIGTSTQGHRKACIIFRQSLEPGSIYADVAFHGDGLTSLQFRTERGGITREIQTGVNAPHRVRLEKRGNMFYLYTTGSNGKMEPTGSSIEVPLEGTFYIGLGVCSHDASVFETAVFSDVATNAVTSEGARIRSSLQTVHILSGDRRSVYATRDIIQSPNWSHDGKSMYFNRDGRLYAFALAPGSVPKEVDTDGLRKIGNDHGISPDGTRLAFSNQKRKNEALVYTVPIAGGAVKEITSLSPSYWHGWSPDGASLVYSAERNGDSGIYTIPSNGGEEQRLTSSKGLNDGPEYSADGKYVYFNSSRTGTMQIWRMRPDGSEQAQLTSDGYSDWFPHPSPDGKWVVFLSYPKGTLGLPTDQNVMLRVLAVDTGDVRVLASFLGGEGTIDSPSWAPDSIHLAFVAYQPVFK